MRLLALIAGLLLSLPLAAAPPTDLVVTTPDGRASRVRIDDARPAPTPHPPGGVHTMPPSTWFELNAAALMKPARGLSTLRVQPTTIVANPDPTVGAFRVGCAMSHMLFDDPIVYPGQPGRSHLHFFFGNTGANAASTGSSIANAGGSTCVGGIANRSAYWIPGMVDISTGFPVPAHNSVNYYKGDYRYYFGARRALITVVPDGLRMIAGNPLNRLLNGGAGVYRWDCVAPGANSSGQIIPAACPIGGEIILTVNFPNCWDGANLDAPDHQSHMQYSTGNGCPASHPVPIPVISMNVHWKITAQSRPDRWRLASDGYEKELPPGLSAHADFFEGWNREIKAAFTRFCINEGRDCKAHLLGDGRTLH